MKCVYTVCRTFSSASTRQAKVTVLGAAGGIGQPLSLLLKQSPLITQLNLYDIVHTPGVAADLSHIETASKVQAFVAEKDLLRSLEGADIVLIPAGVPRKPGMTRDDLFNTNASIVLGLVNAFAKACPNAFLGIITNPVNSTVPIAVEALKRKNVYDWRRVFGVTTLDVVRANRFVAEARHTEISKTNVPVIGGHSGDTIIPVFSHATPKLTFTPAEHEKLVKRIQNAGTEVVEAKAGTGSATLSMAYAAARFAFSLIRAKNGQSVTECAYVKNQDPNVKLEYFALPCVLSTRGVEEAKPIVDKLNDFEKHLLTKALPELKANIEKGEKWARTELAKPKYAN